MSTKQLANVWFAGKRTIVYCTRSNDGQLSLPVGKSGERCYTSGYFEKTWGGKWEDLEWLPNTVAEREDLPVAKDIIDKHKTSRQSYK
jgi:hypothetical protein